MNYSHILLPAARTNDPVERLELVATFAVSALASNFDRYIFFFLNSGFYDLALIQSFFGVIEIVRTFFNTIHRRIFKNVKD